MKNIIKWVQAGTYRFEFENTQTKIAGCMLKEYDFSIVMAVYNSSEFLREAMESILKQTIGFSKVQVILVDDGSTDDSGELCDQYADMYPQNIVVVHKLNGGVSSARNVGMKYALGKYINFMDSDDKLSLNALEQVYAFFEKNQNKTDVVTIKVELFGAKEGDTWFNKKFEKGNRILNLFQEPQIYLNSVNNCFFHKRIINQLFFDEELSISEDLKMVNTALMNKYALGVIASCKYYYRIRSAESGSLAATARKKYCWYLVYLDRVFFWLYELSVKKTGQFLKYLQYTLLRDLFNRFKDNEECEHVLNEEEIILYKEKLLSALKLIDLNVFKQNNFINTDYQVYFYSKIYGCPIIKEKEDKACFIWNNNLIVTKGLYLCYENLTVSKNIVTIEGYFVINNVGYKESDYVLVFKTENHKYEAELIHDTNNNSLAFADEYIFYRKYFKFSFEVNEKSQIKPYVYVSRIGVELPISVIGFGCWFGVQKTLPAGHFCKDDIDLSIVNGNLYIETASKLSLLKKEIDLIKALRSKKRESGLLNQAYKMRKYHFLMRLIPKRKIWIVSDRCLSAGDNGQAFYSYLKKKGVNAYFAIESDSEDFNKLKNKHFKVLDLKSRRYRLKFLMADYIVSAHFDNLELRPITNNYVSDILAKKTYVFLQHGITKDDVSKFYSRKKQNIDAFITAARPEYQSIVENPNYFCKEHTFLTGFARYDKLVNSCQNIILIMPTWRNDLVSFQSNSKEPKVSNKFVESYYYSFYHNLLKNEKLNALAQSYGYKIMYFPHYNMLATNHYFEDIENITIMSKPDERNYNEMFSKAKIMVTDYSSTAFDFAYLRKPIIYCQGDREEFFHNHTYDKGYFDYCVDGFGPIVNAVDDTVDAIENLLKKDAQIDEMYLKRINDFFTYNDRNNCKRIYDAIRNIKK